MLTSVSATAHYSAIVVDAESGKVIYANDPAQRWYPASLTKVMTLYLTFSALESGRLRLDDLLNVSAHASRQPMSKLGLRSGQHITVEQAILAVATRSANDAAVVLAEHLGGSEPQFASMMTHQAHKLGMHSTSFQNASGLPDEGQISSARDLAILSLSLIRNFPQYYPYFSTQQFDYKGYRLPNTNRILRSYPDADGLKTGFTCGSGYNLIASASRNGQRVIGVLLGAHSSNERFQQMGNLLDLGFDNGRSPAYGNVHVTELSDENNLPPPFQLSSNGCAGSARNMGADVDTIQASNTKIYIPPSKNRIAHANSSSGSPVLAATRHVSASKLAAKHLANRKHKQTTLLAHAQDKHKPDQSKQIVKANTAPPAAHKTQLVQNNDKKHCKSGQCAVPPGNKPMTVAAVNKSLRHH